MVTRRGGPSALAVILAGVPKDFPAAIVIVQHVDEQFTTGMTEWLSGQTGLPVRVAKEGDRVTAGSVFMAGTSDHLILKGADRLSYTAEPRQYVYRPSVDVFFESVSRLWRGEAVGVLLTGMGKDGARGLRMLRDHGHHTIAQDEATSAVYGMPKAAAAGRRSRNPAFEANRSAAGRTAPLQSVTRPEIGPPSRKERQSAATAAAPRCNA